MQVPLKWIKELIDIETVKLEELIERLTLGGFEVEEILEIEVNKKKQTVLDISATANRSDSLSIQGISLEMASLLNQKVNELAYSKKIVDWEQKIYKKVEPIQSELGCSTFLAIQVENLENLTVPSWIQEKLISAGVTPTNSLLDFQTYLLLETGYPFAFYDLDKIKKKVGSSNLSFSLEQVMLKQEFVASNNLTYNLNNLNLIIKANNLSIGIAGIIESKEYVCSESTNSLIIEASIFNAAKIRQQSRYLGLRTDRSARYEKSLKQTYLLASLYRLISLLRINNPNIVCEVRRFFEKKEQPTKVIKLHYSTIKEILGPISPKNPSDSNFISSEKISEYLRRLNFKFLYQDSDAIWEVQIPSFRSDDITREIDLIEEVGRLYGFNNFLTALPKIAKIGIEDVSYQTRKRITSCLLNLGLNELIHYSLVGDKENESLTNKNEIQLINPLLSDYKNLRISLLPTLVETVVENLKQSNQIIEGFEYGHVFSGDMPNNLQEIEHVAGILGGTKEKLSWSEPEKILTWFEAKGKIEQLFTQLNMDISWKMKSNSFQNNLFHPYRTAELCLGNGKSIGKFGQIHPAYATINGISSRIYLFEFRLSIIEEQIQQNKLPIFQEYSSYPRIIKDLSFIISKDIPFIELKNILYLNGTKFLSEINLLDEYKGSSIPDQQISLCIQLIFQSNETTLENKEIDNIIVNLQSILTNSFNAIIRE